MQKVTPSDAVYAPPSAYHLGVSRKEERAHQRERQAFRNDERIHLNEQRHANDERRHADMVAKTKRLRELRLARDAAQQEASAARKP
jgi:hypothetical protein